jgi:hypothetical protein
MYVIELSTNSFHPVEVIPVESSDYKLFLKKRYFFDWSEEKGNEVYKLVLKGANNVLGLVSIERIPSEWRVHIRLLTVSLENKGKSKQYDRIAGNLITHTAKIAVREYGELACVSLRPKSEIVQHYIDKYRMTITGRTLSIEVPEILDLINEYDHD